MPSSFIPFISLPLSPLPSHRPTSLDTALYAHLIFITQAPLAQSQLQQLVLSHAPLRAFLSAMTNRLTAARAALQDGSAVPPPLSRPFAPSTGAAGRKESRSAQSSTESSKSRSSAWLFVLAQVAAIIGYIVVSSVSLELGEDDDEEEEETERSGRRHGVSGSERGGLRGRGVGEEDGDAEGEDGEEDGDIGDDDDDE
ncbi:unnamed protein product [Closterium sp. Yama58-4]|nr:unnamed protein product [Closterium sp. Yama58-4]